MSFYYDYKYNKSHLYGVRNGLVNLRCNKHYDHRSRAQRTNIYLKNSDKNNSLLIFLY